MKQLEKRQKTYNKILLSAIDEFGENGYDNTSINTICSKYNISKGLIYHNFQSKDELYLCSVGEAFKKLVEHLKDGDYVNENNYEKIKKLLDIRQDFFENFQSYRNIFFEAILNPPNHLIKEIQNIRKEYDEFNIEKFKELLKEVKLRKNITEEMAISYFLIYQEMFNGYFQNKIYKSKDLLSISEEHDLKLLSMLDVMLYGIASDKSEEKRDN